MRSPARSRSVPARKPQRLRTLRAIFGRKPSFSMASIERSMALGSGGALAGAIKPTVSPKLSRAGFISIARLCYSKLQRQAIRFPADSADGLGASGDESGDGFAQRLKRHEFVHHFIHYAQALRWLSKTFGEGGEQENRLLRGAAFDCGGQLGAGHGRHKKIGNHQVKLTGLKGGQCVGSIVDSLNPVAIKFEKGGNRFTNQGFVIDDQHAMFSGLIVQHTANCSTTWATSERKTSRW